jgi:6,7-dimethyl-8-ribityllumazine synthase
MRSWQSAPKNGYENVKNFRHHENWTVPGAIDDPKHWRERAEEARVHAVAALEVALTRAPMI